MVKAMNTRSEGGRGGGKTWRHGRASCQHGRLGLEEDLRRIRIEGRGGMAEEGKWKRTRNERGGGEEEEQEEEEEDMSA